MSDDENPTTTPPSEDEPATKEPVKGAPVLQLLAGLAGASGEGAPPESGTDLSASDLFDNPDQILPTAHVGLQVRVRLEVMVPVDGKLVSAGFVRPTLSTLNDAIAPHKLSVQHLDEWERLSACESDLIGLLKVLDEALDDGETFPEEVREELERIHRESRLA